MSDYKYDVEYLEVGDTFEGGPIEHSYFISAIMAAGGEVDIVGNIVTILQLPKKAKAPVYDEKAVEAFTEALAAVEELLPEPVEEAVVEEVAEEVAEEEAVVEDPEVAIAPAPKLPVAKRKFTPKPVPAPAPEKIEE